MWPRPANCQRTVWETDGEDGTERKEGKGREGYGPRSGGKTYTAHHDAVVEVYL